MVTQDLVVLLEDENSVQESFKNMFEDLKINLELVCCTTPDEYEKFLSVEVNRSRMRVLIMDLSNTQSEDDAEANTVGTFAAAKFIRDEFLNNRIPIFIHSSKLQYFNELADQGTVWKIEKSANSIEDVCNKIGLLLKTDFLNIFCFGGKLEQKIMKELHEAFVSQFKKNEIEEIINSMEAKEPDIIIERVSEVFERVAIRSLYENWISTKEIDGQLEEKKLNAIEHYYRRTSDYEIWTGDVFQSKNNQDLAIVLTPRCNVGHANYEELLLCKIVKLEGEKLKSLLSKKGEENLRKNVTDDVKLTQERYRFLPRTPQFEGGVVDYRTLFTRELSAFSSEYERVISLSDELTNDVVRKLSAYLSRGGISETEFSEAHHYMTSTLEKEEANQKSSS